MTMIDFLALIENSPVVRMEARQHPSHWDRARESGQLFLRRQDIVWEVLSSQKWETTGKGPGNLYFGQVILSAPRATCPLVIFIKKNGEVSK